MFIVSAVTVTALSVWLAPPAAGQARPRQTATITTGDSTIASGATIRISATARHHDSWAWTSDNGGSFDPASSEPGKPTRDASTTWTAPTVTSEEDFELTLTAAISFDVGISADQDTVTITVIPPPDPLTVMFSDSSYTVDEGDSESVTVELSADAPRALDIPIIVTRRSAESGDYRVSGLSGGSVSFSGGQRSESFTIQSRHDSDCSDERIDLDFGTLPPGVSLGSPDEATFWIDDDEDHIDCSSPPSYTNANPLHRHSESRDHPG